MKKLFTILTALTLSAVAAFAQFAPTNLLVVRVGDGVNAVANTSGPISLLEITRSGTVVQTINISTNSLQLSGTSSSEGQISLSPDGSILTIGGYVPPFTGSGSLATRTAVQAPRGYVTVDASGVVSASTIISNAYSTDNLRSATTDGSSFWFTGGAGSGSGIMAYSGGVTNQLADVNSRTIKIFSNNLYYSTGAGTQGIYQISGTPTSSNAAPISILTGVAGQGTSPYDFAFSPDGNTLYVADSNLGIQKFTSSGSAWSLAYNLTNSLTSGDRALGLDVLFGATNQVTWTSATNIWSVLDGGFATNATSIYSTGTSTYVLRGLEATVVPEPSTYAMLALAGAGFAGYVIRRRRR